MTIDIDAYGTDLPADFPERRRVQMTIACCDCDAIPKVEGAGDCFAYDGGTYQRMHNGVRVVEGGYYGRWMAEIIQRLGGHHEPQEELAFHEVLKQLEPGARMVEFGGFWAYYSLWFHHAIEGAVNYVVEPDPNHIEIGRTNFALNGFDGHFEQYAAGAESQPGVEMLCEDGVQRRIPMISVDDFLREHEIEFLDLLHADIQGSELPLLQGARRAIEEKKLRFVFISTHHHSISGDPLTHHRCRDALIEAGARILADHTVAESFSGDGLLVASLDERDANLGPIPLSYNRAGSSLFRETEYDLAEAIGTGTPENLARAKARKPPFWRRAIRSTT